MNINIDEILQLAKEGYITRTAHPALPLFVLNYTHKAQFDRVWTPETLMCRGLIVNDRWEIQARPFKKFFNLEEHQSALPEGPFEVFDKLDGSLGILYWQGQTPYIATRGSFTSEQAQHATAILHQRYSHVQFDPDLTYLFEIIYPQNRIVIDYGVVDDIFLLAVIETARNEEYPILDIGLPMVKRYDGISDFRSLTQIHQDNQEGYVVKWPDGFRVKMKFAEYVRLHRILTGTNTKTVWEWLREGKSLEELIAKVPDEFYQWVQATAGDLHMKFKMIEAEAKANFKDLGDRKTNALYYQTKPNSGILFSMLDQRDYADYIWKLIRPKAERPFKDVQEDF